MQNDFVGHPAARNSERDPLEGNEDYSFVRIVGSGSFGCVAQAIDRGTNETVAIKFIPRGGDFDIERVKREILNHRNLCHFHVVRFHKLILTRTHLGIVMEYADGGNLKDYIRRAGPLSSRQTRFFFQQLVLGVEYCHKMDVVNRDIKLQNTLVTGKNREWPMLKICDFGYSKHDIADSKPDSRVGTRMTMPPEVVSLAAGEKYDGVKADIWCIGLFLYVLVANRYPFCGPSEIILDAELFRRIVELEFEIPAEAPDDSKDLIRRILVRNPDQRPTIDEIKADPYFLLHLPDGAEHMNQHLVRQRSQQTVEEMEWILESAKGSLFSD